MSHINPFYAEIESLKARLAASEAEVERLTRAVAFEKANTQESSDNGARWRWQYEQEVARRDEAIHKREEAERALAQAKADLVEALTKLAEVGLEAECFESAATKALARAERAEAALAEREREVKRLREPYTGLVEFFQPWLDDMGCTIGENGDEECDHCNLGGVLSALKAALTPPQSEKPENHAKDCAIEVHGPLNRCTCAKGAE